MSSISREDFDIMVGQLLDESNVRFDMLCAIAHKTLRSTVGHWCANDPFLRGKQLEDDIMQDICIRLIKTCKSSFLLRNGIGGELNNDPDGFKSWIYKVALNIKRDYSNAARNRSFKERDFADGEEEIIPGGDPWEDSDERRELLKAAFEIVLNSDNQVYKVLTWITQCLFVLEFDITKIQSNGMIVELFGDKTLNEMYITVMGYSKKLPWLVISGEQRKRIEKQLEKPWTDGRMYGQVKYSEFFMKKGGKASISDWVNRMNNLVKRVVEDEASDS